MIVRIVVALPGQMSSFLADVTSSICLGSASPAGGGRALILSEIIRLKLVLTPLIRTVAPLLVLIIIRLEVSVSLTLTTIGVGPLTLGSAIGLIVITIRLSLSVWLGIKVTLSLVVRLLVTSIPLVLEPRVIPVVSSTSPSTGSSVAAEALASVLGLKCCYCFNVGCSFVF